MASLAVKKDCNRRHYRANREVYIARSRAWSESNPGRKIESYRQKKYGITPEQMTALLIKQNGRCAICSEAFRDEKWQGPHVDHDHITDAVRGLLCRGCNGWLGWFEREGMVQAATKYLADYSTQES